jgi:hypothetical protein
VSRPILQDHEFASMIISCNTKYENRRVRVRRWLLLDISCTCNLAITTRGCSMFRKFDTRKRLDQIARIIVHFEASIPSISESKRSRDIETRTFKENNAISRSAYREITQSVYTYARYFCYIICQKWNASICDTQIERPRLLFTRNVIRTNPRAINHRRKTRA